MSTNRCALLPYEIEELARVAAYGPVQVAERFLRLMEGGWIELYDEEIGGYVLTDGASGAIWDETGSVREELRSSSRIAQALLLTIRSRAFDIEQRIEYGLRFPTGRGAMFDALLAADLVGLAALIEHVCTPFGGVPECDELLVNTMALRRWAHEMACSEGARRTALHTNRLAATAAFGQTA